VRGAGGGAGAGAGDSPAAGIMGEHRPLAPFLHGFMGALPHGYGIHGGDENAALVATNSWVEVSPTGGGVPYELGFLPLYSLSDSRLPILDRTRSGLTRPSGLRIR
jgi:hypothetical protein